MHSNDRSEPLSDMAVKNCQLAALIGMATSLIMDVRDRSPQKHHYKYDWFLDAVNATIYLNDTLPPFPPQGVL